jgi:hypothetical protein
VIVAVVVVDGACAGVVESTSDAFALALQIFVNRQLSLQMKKSIFYFFSPEMASASSDNNNCIF